MPGPDDELIPLTVSGDAGPEVRSVDWVPPADIVETAKGYEITLEVCGVRRKELAVRLEGGRLTVWGIRQAGDDTELAHYRERRTGRFMRAFEFRAPIDESGVSARLAQGLLTLTVPKKRPRQIPLE